MMVRATTPSSEVAPLDQAHGELIDDAMKHFFAEAKDILPRRSWLIRMPHYLVRIQQNPYPAREAVHERLSANSWWREEPSNVPKINHLATVGAVTGIVTLKLARRLNPLAGHEVMGITAGENIACHKWGDEYGQRFYQGVLELAGQAPPQADTTNEHEIDGGSTDDNRS